MCKAAHKVFWVKKVFGSKNNWGPLSSTFHVGRPETLIEWKFESITYQRTNRLTWVGARDACASKNIYFTKSREKM